MKRKGGWLSSGLIVLGLLAAAWPVRAGGFEDFKLTRAIPADSMLVVQTRDHAGKAFVDEQMKRVWAAVEKQNFDRDFKRLLRNAVKEQEGDVEEFDRQWQQITDLAAGVSWSQMCEREFALALKLGMPTGAEFVLLAMPPADQVTKDFDGLTAILKNLVAMAPKDMLVLNTEGEGETVVHKLALANQMTPLGLTLARQKDVVLLGLGASMVEQALALLRGETKADVATLASTERFKQAFQKLPAPTDSLFFVDVSKIMAQARVFAKMAESMSPPTTQESAETATQPAAKPLAFLIPLIDELDLWEYAASVSTTEGMKTTTDEVTALRDDAKGRALYKAFYGGGPVKQPLKFIPKEATAVSVSRGLDFGALYKAILDFVQKQIPEGKNAIAMWEQKQKEVSFNLEDDVLSWLGSGFATFTAARASTYSPEWVFMLNVADEQKATQKLEQLFTRLNEQLTPQQGGVEDAKLEGAEGFKVIMLPPLAAMMIGQPVVGVKSGELFVANNAKIVATALKVGAGEAENFSKSERFAKEGLPLGDNVTAFSFKDLSKLGDELSQAFSMVGVIQPFLPPEVSKDPAIVTLISAFTKVGRVVKTLDFYRSTCSVSTFDGKFSTTKTVVNYQEPPKPKAPESGPAESGPSEGPAGSPAPEKQGEKPKA